MGKNISPENMPTSLNIEPDDNRCRICGGESQCENLGVIRYDVPVGDPRFGKLFRCPNNPVEADTDRHERLRRISNLDAYADKNFHNFTVEQPTLKPAEHQSLEVALTISARYAENPEGWLLLEGTYGCGKTHLAAAIGNERLQRGEMVMFITVPDLLDHLRSAYAPSAEATYDETFERIRNTPMLILDDLGAESPSQWAKEKLFQLLNHRYSHRLPTIITTNADLDTLDPRIRSRLLDSELIKRGKITAPDYRTYARSQGDQLSNLAAYSEMTFETFDTRRKVIGEEGENLHRALEKAITYAQSPQEWLLITGPNGTGKTHLAAAIANYRQQQGSDVVFVTVPDLLDYLRVTFNPNAPVTFDQRFQMVRNTPFLVLDDFTSEGSAWAKEKLFQILDYRYVSRRPTVITTYKPVDDMDARIRTRLLDKRRCSIFAITVQDYASRLNRRKS
jgi:DNA replication protein DnaC